MVEHLTGRQLRTVAWLVLLGKKHGAQVLDEPQRFDELIGAGQFAVLDGEDLELARRYFEEGAKGTRVGA